MYLIFIGMVVINILLIVKGIFEQELIAILVGVVFLSYILNLMFRV